MSDESKSSDERLKLAYDLAYGSLSEKMYGLRNETRVSENVVQNDAPAPVQESPVQEAPVQEQAAEAPAMTNSFMAGDKPKLSSPKDRYPSMFSLFSEMLDDKSEDKSGEDLFVQMFTLAFEAMMGKDVFRELLDKREKELQEKLERERQARVAAEQKLEAQQKAPETPKTASELAYDKIAKGKEEVTLADLKRVGVNLKTDLQPTLRALTTDNPEKLKELAPKGLSDEKSPVSKEFAVALIGRAQQREAIARHNVAQRV